MVAKEAIESNGWANKKLIPVPMLKQVVDLTACKFADEYRYALGEMGMNIFKNAMIKCITNYVEEKLREKIEADTEEKIPVKRGEEEDDIVSKMITEGKNKKAKEREANNAMFN